MWRGELCASTRSIDLQVDPLVRRFSAEWVWAITKACIVFGCFCCFLSAGATSKVIVVIQFAHCWGVGAQKRDKVLMKWGWVPTDVHRRALLSKLLVNKYTDLMVTWRSTITDGPRTHQQDVFGEPGWPDSVALHCWVRWHFKNGWGTIWKVFAHETNRPADVFWIWDLNTSIKGTSTKKWLDNAWHEIISPLFS